jgi:hypothetical protein
VTLYFQKRKKEKKKKKKDASIPKTTNDFNIDDDGDNDN